MTRYSYQQLIELVEGDTALIELLVEEGEIQRRDEVALVDLDRVLVAHTLLRELDVTWPGVEIILQLRAQLMAAQRRIATLEAELAAARAAKR